ncbi:MAG: tail fiber domain-containing protein [Terriglobales bacterium]
MKTHVACVILVVLSMGLFAVAQQTANDTPSAAALSGAAASPLVTYKAVKTAAPYGTANYLSLWTGSNTIANSVLYQSGLNVGIGTTSPAATLDVNGTVNAATSFNLGGTAFAFGSYANGNALFGFAGNSTMTGAGNTASGYKALYSNTSGGDNTASGIWALYNNTTASYNTASGYAALAGNTTGVYNTAGGSYSLYINSTGSENTANGFQALNSNTTGGENTANGADALFHSTTGNSNTASGVGALYSNNTGNSNVAVGGDALYSNVTGSSLTCIGFNCLTGVDGLTNATAIGAGAVVSESNALVLGATGVKVGIGTPTPSNIFTIARSAGQAISDGWTTYSSRRWKTNIHTLHDALAKVEALRGVSYDLKTNGQHEVGVIAEEVGAVVPEVVTWEKNGKDAQSVDYGRLTALLIEATKEQQALIREQKKQIRAQQAEINAQQIQVSKLTSEVKAIRTSLQSNRRGDTQVLTLKTEASTVHQ